MHVLITGAAGMVGRKLTERLVADGGLNGKPVDKLTLVDVVAPKRPPAFPARSTPMRSTSPATQTLAANSSLTART